MRSIIASLRECVCGPAVSASTNKTQDDHPAHVHEQFEPVSEDYPSFPPPPPPAILADRDHYRAIVDRRKYAAPRGVYEDSSLFALYRLYEFIVLDYVFGYRNLLEWFWRKKEWPVHEIPDPQDSDPARYAFLACVTYLMVRSFNARVSLGLTRGGRAIMLTEEVEEARSRPHHERTFERVPAWAEAAPPLAETLSIPTHDGVTLNGISDERADQDFLKKNILIWTPHIHFT